MNEDVTDALRQPGDCAVRVGFSLGAIVLAAVVIFSLGVMVGSRVAELPPVDAAPPSALPTETLRPLPLESVAPTAPTPPDKLTFYDRLSGVAPAAPPELPEGQPPVQALTPAPKPEQAAPARQPDPLPLQATGAAAPNKVPPLAAKEAAPRAAPPKTDPAAQISKLSGKGRFTVQMAAVSDRTAAAETAALIKRNGFDAVTVMASVKGKILYRIRVGSFPSKQAAAQAAGIFHSAYGLNGIAVEN